MVEVNDNNNARLTLRKDEKLRHLSLIEPLFTEGKSLYQFPLRVIWKKLSVQELNSSFRNGIPAKIGKLQMLVTVPKKKRRRAVDRVLMRRRIREAYRLNRKDILGEAASRQDTGTICMAFIYIHNENLPYSTIERKVKSLLKKVADNVNGCC